ncbi:response regulator [Rhizobium bangladeshense]|uniref:response regulator n=1 Tax=Rhizobium bangladeshense TaxID=1138189 RepID=UPI0007E55FF2|nr:response regulator [Rhizobium bangladeshense]
MTATLVGRRLLIVEDEYLIARDLVQLLRNDGAEVIGPVATVDAALDLIDETPSLDGAVLDINLQGEMAYPIADVLTKRGVPFVFATGYDDAAILGRYRDVPRCEKPVAILKIAQSLF